MIYGWGIFSEIALRWMPLDIADDHRLLAHGSYREISNIRSTNTQKLEWLLSRLAVAFGQSIEAKS